MPRWSIARAKASISERRLTKSTSATPSGPGTKKTTVPMLSEAMSGAASSDRMRRATGIPASPVVSCTTSGQRPRMPSFISLKIPGSATPLPDASLACRCTMAAPAFQHSTAASTISPGCSGSAGLACFPCNPPVSAAVMMSFSIYFPFLIRPQSTRAEAAATPAPRLLPARGTSSWCTGRRRRSRRSAFPRRG